MEASIKRFELLLRELEGSYESQTNGYTVDPSVLIKELYVLKGYLRENSMQSSHHNLQSTPLASSSVSVATSETLFHLILRYLITHGTTTTAVTPLNTFSSGNGTTSFSLSTTNTIINFSECTQQLICDCLAASYRYTEAQTISETLSSKQTHLYVKITLCLAVSRLCDQDALPFLPEIMALAIKVCRQVDFYLKQCLLQSVTQLMDRESDRSYAHQTDALKLVNRLIQDKFPEVRTAAAHLLLVVAKYAISLSSSMESHSSGLFGFYKKSTAEGHSRQEERSLGSRNEVDPNSASSSFSNKSTLQCTNTSSKRSGEGSTQQSVNHGAGKNLGHQALPSGAVSLDTIMQVALKGIEDSALEVRRMLALVSGTILAKYAATLSCQDYTNVFSKDTTSRTNNMTVANSSMASDTDGEASSDRADSNADLEVDTTASSIPNTSGVSTVVGRSKLGFKLPLMHTYSISSLQLSLSRRRPPIFSFATIASIILHYKELICSKYLNPPQKRHNGGILAFFAIALCSMFEQLPNSVVEIIQHKQLEDIIEALTSLLDLSFFSLNDLVCARNAVTHVLRFGLFAILAERQQEALWEIYISKLNEESSSLFPTDENHCGINQMEEQHSISELSSTKKQVNHHKSLTFLSEISHLIPSLGEASIIHAREAYVVLKTLLSHEKQSVRHEASIALASLSTTLSYRQEQMILDYTEGIRKVTESLLPTDSFSSETAIELLDKSQLYQLQGYTSALTHAIRGRQIFQREHFDPALPDEILSDIFDLAKRLIQSQFTSNCPDSIWLTCTRAGWAIIAVLSIIAGDQWQLTHLQSLLDLWLKCSSAQNRETSLELLRIEASTTALHSFVTVCDFENLANKELLQKSVHACAGHVLHQYLVAITGSLRNPTKRRGQAARDRLFAWIFSIFSLIPDPMIYQDSHFILSDLIAEFSTAVSMTNARHVTFVPTESSYLKNTVDTTDDVLEMISIPRLQAGDYPSFLYSRDLNLLLSLSLPDQSLSDIEVEMQDLDIFWALYWDSKDSSAGPRDLCNSFTYVRLVDASVILFGKLFAFLIEDLQLRCLQHYASTLAKGQKSCEVNVCCLLAAAMRNASETTSASSGSLQHEHINGNDAWCLQIQTMLLDLLSSENAQVRRAAGVTIGQLAKISDDQQRRRLVLELEKQITASAISASQSMNPSETISSFIGTNTGMATPVEGNTSLATNVKANYTPAVAKNGSDTSSVCLYTGAIFALACMKRSCGFQIVIDTGLIFRFGGELCQPQRTWVLHSWNIIMESVSGSGGEYEQYIHSSDTLLDVHLLAGFQHARINRKGLRWQSSSKAIIGRFINNILASIGSNPPKSAEWVRKSLVMWDMLLQDPIVPDASIQVEYLKFLKQVLLFAPEEFRNEGYYFILQILSNTEPAHGYKQYDEGGRYPTMNFQLCVPRSSGSSRPCVQNLALSCILVMAERLPENTHRDQLYRVLLMSLSYQIVTQMWSYRSRLQGLCNHDKHRISYSRRNDSVKSIQTTILALIDAGFQSQVKTPVCLWAMFFRSIAIGESAETIGDIEGSQQQAQTPKNVNSGFKNSGDAHFGNVTHSSLTEFIQTTAISIQVERWRHTKLEVRKMLLNVPQLCRQTRFFAIECVLHIFELLSGSQYLVGDSSYKLIPYGGQAPSEMHLAFKSSKIDIRHFDLYAVHQSFSSQLYTSVRQGTDKGDKSKCHDVVASEAVRITEDFLCFYLDEFISLSCHAATLSLDGHELMHFQRLGLRLMHILIAFFGFSTDPAIPDNSHFLLDPYQAQIASALRQASKLCQKISPTKVSEQMDFSPAFLIQVQALLSDTITCRLVVDKKALQRLCQNLVDHNNDCFFYSDGTFTRKALCLANLSNIARLIVSSIDFSNDRKIMTLSDFEVKLQESSLLHVLGNEWSGHLQYLVRGWMEISQVYASCMQDTVPPGRAGMDHRSWNIKNISPGNSRKLHDLLTLYWSNIGNVISIWLIWMPRDCNNGCEDHMIDLYQPDFIIFFLGCYLCHIRSQYHTRRDLRTEMHILPALLSKTIPLIAKDYPSAYKEILNAIFGLLLRCTAQGPSSYSCLALGSFFTIIHDLKISALVDRDDTTAGLLCVAVSMSLKLLKQAHRERDTEKTESDDISELLKVATLGIVLVRHRDGAIFDGNVAELAINTCDALLELLFSEMIKSASISQSCRLASASLEMLVSRCTEAECSTQSRVTVMKIYAKMIRSVRDAITKTTNASAYLEYSLQIACAYIVKHPNDLQKILEAFVNGITKEISKCLDQAFDSLKNDQDGHDSSVLTIATVLLGMENLMRKLAASGYDELSAAACGRLIPRLVGFLQLYDGNIISSILKESTSSTTVLRHIKAILLLFVEHCRDEIASELMHLLIPMLVQIVNFHRGDNPSMSLIPSVEITTELLLALARAKNTFFKQVVVSLSHSMRSALEQILRNAVCSPTIPTLDERTEYAMKTTDLSNKKLDLSLYRSSAEVCKTE